MPSQSSSTQMNVPSESFIFNYLISLQLTINLCSYLSNFKKAFDDLSKEAEAVAGIKVCSMILYEKQDGHFKIDR